MKTQTDALSRFHTFGETTADIDEEILCFLVTQDEPQKETSEVEEDWFSNPPHLLSSEKLPILAIKAREIYREKTRDDKTAAITARFEAGEIIPFELSPYKLLSRVETEDY